MSEITFNSWLICIFGLMANLMIGLAFFAFKRQLRLSDERHEQKQKHIDLVSIQTEAIVYSLIFSAESFSGAKFKEEFDARKRQLMEEYRMIHDRDIGPVK